VPLRKYAVPEQYQFTIPIRPKSKGRPRVTKNGTFTPKATREYEAAVKSYYKGPKFDGPVSLTISLYKDKAFVTIKEVDVDFSPLRGDISNYVKGIEDALNGLAYDDDRQIHLLKGSKK
jgi:crossover junction endodeoxyribonuclease RusA